MKFTNFQSRFTQNFQNGTCSLSPLKDSIETAHNEYVSYGKAKGKIMGANRSPESTYAKVVAKMKINDLGKSPQL